jgi:hypothetical protein
MMQTTSDHGKTPEHAPLQLVSSTSTVLPHTALAGGEFSTSPSTNSECLAVLVGSTVQILLSAVLAREDGLNTVSVTPSAASMHNQWVQTSECDRASSVGHAQPHTSTATLRSFSNGLEEGKAVTPKVISHWTFGFCTFVPQFLNPITVVGTVRLHGLRLRVTPYRLRRCTSREKRCCERLDLFVYFRYLYCSLPAMQAHAIPCQPSCSLEISTLSCAMMRHVTVTYD